MKKNIILSLIFGFVFICGCSVFEQRPAQNNIDQARGSYVWMNQRLDEEEDANQLEGQFGNQSNSNLNDERVVNDY